MDFKAIAEKWQRKWEEASIFKVKEDPSRPKYYCLEMLPYPSGALHMGHVRNYSIGDAFARYKRMRGFNVLYPMGYDSLGLPAENAAIKNKSHPKKWTVECIEIMKQQQFEMGFSYDWDRSYATYEDEYLRWEQWLFIKFYEKGLAYKKKAPVNWCPGCQTVLANEQVEDGKCYRCKSLVEAKELDQWFFKITAYADELLGDLDRLEHWPERVKTMQKNWIGKSHGIEILFKLKDSNKVLPAFTTRPDTIFSVTFVVMAPEHPWVEELVKGTLQEKAVKEFVNKVARMDRFERTAEDKEKEGIFTGKYVINPATGEEIPVWLANFALVDYGTGIVMADAHDQRDFEFAKKYGIPLKLVIAPDGKELDVSQITRAVIEDGILVNSGQFNRMPNREAIEPISQWLEENGKGKRTVNYKLRDWLLSRQRYWGCPIPILYCDTCGTLPVPEKDLPIRLPEDVQFTGQGNPIETSKSFQNTSCPKCGAKARRETDTMDTFVDSSWYFLRYCSPQYEKGAFDRKAVDYWMPIDQYIGGIEHAILHLLYARFYTKVLRDLGLTTVDEPFTRLLCQGMVLNGGEVMSKSKGNGVDPSPIIEQYGPDTLRHFILFIALPEKELEWSDQGIEASFKFLMRVSKLLESVKYREEENSKDHYVTSITHKTVKKVTEYLEEFKLSLALGTLMELTNKLAEYKEDPVYKETFQEALQTLVLLLSPFTPHLSEELWEQLGQKGFCSLQEWPEFDEGKIDVEAEAGQSFIQETVRDIRAVLTLAKIDKPKKVRLFVAENWKYDYVKLLKGQMEKTRNLGEILKILMASDLREYSQEISKLTPKFVKDPSKLPQVVLTQDLERKQLTESQSELEKELGCSIEVQRVEDSQETKAKQALPGKPAIVVE